MSRKYSTTGSRTSSEPVHRGSRGSHGSRTSRPYSEEEAVPVARSDDEDGEEDETSVLLPPDKTINFSRISLSLDDPENDEFFACVKSGDVSQLFRFLQERPTFDINCRNYQSYTALIEATMDDNLDMVRYLVTLPSINPYDAVLHAVNTGNGEILMVLLDWQTHHEEQLSIIEGVEDTAAFTPDITPLMLACHNNNYNLIHLLLTRGLVLDVPHPPNCFCHEVCHYRLDGEDLQDSRARLNKVRALCSPDYICQTSFDPILTCFMLSEDAKQFAHYEPHFLTEYLALAELTSEFATTMLGLCRTSKEIEFLLTVPYGNERRQLNHVFPRLLLALDLQQKSFVAHAHTQHVLRIAWLGPWQRWHVMSALRKVAYVISRLLILPIMAIIYMIVPGLKAVQKWRAPVNKFITFVCSYFIFIGLLFAQDHIVAKNVTRGPPDSGIEWVLVIYSLSFGWISIKQLQRQKGRFFNDAWNIYDLVMLVLFICTYICWLMSFLDVRNAGGLYLERPQWHPYDWTLLGEAFYSVAFIFAFGKLLFYLQLAQTLGPLQLSLGIMMTDIMKFIVLWGVVMVSFAIGLYTLYHQYIGMVRERDGEIVKQSNCFESISQSISSLYWAVYGYTPPSYTEVIIPEYKEVINNETIIIYNEHIFTETVGQVMCGIYHVCGVIILINMLVAMMSTTFSRIQDNADCEWKFSRTKVWSAFLGSGGTMPPPFNIIPAPKHLYRFIGWLRLKLQGDPSALFSFRKCCFIRGAEDLHFDNEQFEALMSRLVQRYLTHQRESGEADPATVNDLDILHHEVRELKLVNKLLLEKQMLSSKTSLASK